MNLSIRTGALLCISSLLFGCAHPIVVTPNLGAINAAQPAKSARVAGYYISEQDRSAEVTTPGGGGDKVKYRPYADLEYGINRVLTKKYASVVSIKDPNDSRFIADKKVAFVFHPKLVTNSKSDSAFTWPPTEFTIDMECAATNSAGKVIWKRNLRGVGRAEFSEFRSNFSLSAERAATAVLIELQKALDSAPEVQ